MSFPHFIQLLFIALKLTGHIDWSWWIVLIPIMIGIIINRFIYWEEA